MARDRRAAFTLLELLLAIVIVATALVALGASVSSGIGAASESINQRAAREACRAKLEAAAANGDTSGGGQVEGHEAFQWNLTRDEHTAGAIDSPDEKYDILTVTVTYPTDNATSTTPGQQAGPGTATVKLSTIVDPPDLPKLGQPTAPGSTPH